MRARLRRLRGLAAAAVAGATLAACHDGRPVGAANAVEVEMFDHGYRVTGALGAGPAAITTRNTGSEWHMAAFARLRTGRTVDEAIALFEAAAAGSLEDPEAATADVIEKGLGAPGHLLQPGRAQTVTVDNLEPGSYVMFCYLPAEGEGTPHFSKGMVAALDVGVLPRESALPEADTRVVLADGAEPSGVPERLESGRHTFEVVAEGAAPKDFIVSQLDAGQSLDAFREYFVGGFLKPGGPDKGMAGSAPGKVLGSTFQIEAGRRIFVTVDLSPGPTYVSSATIVDGQPHNNLVTVEVS